MSVARAMDIVKDKVPDLSEDELYEAWQTLLDFGVVWRMGTYYSEMAACLLAQGKITRGDIFAD